MADPGAPDPGSLLSSGLWTKVAERRERDRRQRRHRTVALAGVVGLAFAVGLGLALVPGGIGSLDQSAAAAALQTIADDTSPPSTVPGGGTWLYRTMDFSIASPRTTISLTAPSTTIHGTPARSVTLTGVLHSWVKETEAVQSAAFQSPQFGSPRRQAAWQAAGLLTAPVAGTHAIMKGATPGPHSHVPGEGPGPSSRTKTSSPTRTSSPTGTYFSNGLYPVNVSGLPKTAAKLAKALRTGKTGVPGLDSAQHRRSPEAAFERAVLLLLSPTVGSSPQFSAEVYRSIALLPHVVSLGRCGPTRARPGRALPLPRATTRWPSSSTVRGRSWRCGTSSSQHGGFRCRRWWPNRSAPHISRPNRGVTRHWQTSSILRPVG